MRIRIALTLAPGYLLSPGAFAGEPVAVTVRVEIPAKSITVLSEVGP